MSTSNEPAFDPPEPRNPVARMQWVLSALDPDQRSHRITHQLGPWVTWLVHTYRLRTQIPPCWYRHPEVVERLKNLMVGWIHTYTGDPSEFGDRPFAYVEFDDALERELRRITVPPRCLDGDHEDPPVTWTTDTDQHDWLSTSAWATAPPVHPAPDFTTSATDRTEPKMTSQPGPPSAPGLVMSRTDGDAFVQDGTARAMRDYAIHYDGTWWLGDRNTYVRVTDDDLNQQLDFKAIKLRHADQAVARAHQHGGQPTDQPGEPLNAGDSDEWPDRPNDRGEGPS